MRSACATTASARRRVLLVLDRTEHAVWKSFRNLGTRVQIVIPEELNAYDVLLNDWIVFSQATLDVTNARFAAHSAPTERAAASGVSPDAASEAVEQASS